MAKDDSHQQSRCFGPASAAVNCKAGAALRFSTATYAQAKTALEDTLAQIAVRIRIMTVFGMPAYARSADIWRVWWLRQLVTQTFR